MNYRGLLAFILDWKENFSYYSPVCNVWFTHSTRMY